MSGKRVGESAAGLAGGASVAAIAGAEPRVIALADVPAQPWKNGGGLTRELLAWPTLADWTVRVSVADIERDGPFSAFPGVARWFVVLEGEGVRLAFADAVRRERVQRRGDPPLAFDGAAAPACRLVDGPTRDLNLMLRGAGREEGGLVPVAAGRAWRPAAAVCGLFTAVAGTCRDHRGAAFEIPAFSLAWFEAAPASLRFEPGEGERGEGQRGESAACTAAGSAGAIGWWIAAPPAAGAGA